MPLPLQIVFHNVQHSDAVEAAIREKVNKLDQFFGRIMGCRVTVGLIQKHKHQGKLFNVSYVFKNNKLFFMPRQATSDLSLCSNLETVFCLDRCRRRGHPANSA